MTVRIGAGGIGGGSLGFSLVFVSTFEFCFGRIGRTGKITGVGFLTTEVEMLLEELS